MAPQNVFSLEIRKESLSPCYFLYGEETFLAEEFVRRLLRVVFEGEEEGWQVNVEKFSLEETPWADLIDLARTVPFFLASRRILVAEAAEDAVSELTPAEESVLKDYFREPSPRTVLVLILAGKVKKGHPLVRFFSKLPPSSVKVRELKPLPANELQEWISRKLVEGGKSMTSEAKNRLIELAGNDLRRIANELEKIINFAGDKKMVDIEEINEICYWVRPMAGWELTDSLRRGDVKHSLVALNQLFKEGNKDEVIVATLINYFRDILAAKTWLREERDKDEIFARLHPFLKPHFSFYARKYREFFDQVEDFSVAELEKVLEELEQIDLLVKTSDFSLQPRLEAFIVDYQRRRRRARAGAEPTWKTRS